MFKLSRKHLIIRTFVLSAVIVALVSTMASLIIKYKNDSRASAAHAQGDTVRITKGPVIYYTNNDDVSGWSPRYKVRVDGKNEDAYCVQPQAHVTDDEVTTTVTYIDRLGHNPQHGSWTNQERVNMMKLTMFIAQTNDSDFHAAQVAVFGRFQSDGDPTDSTMYIFSHAMLSVLYGKGEPYQYYHGLSDANKQRVDDAIARVKTYIDNNRPVWQSAQEYQMYLARMQDVQDLVWIEHVDPTGSIIVQKCDAEITGSCVAQGNANFDNITFELYNGTTLVSSQTLANGVNTVTFSDLDLDVTYTVRETGSNTYYNLAPDQSLKPTEAGATVTFSDVIKKGSINVTKKDKEVEAACTPSSALISLTGTKFQIFNKSSQSIYYNGNIYPRDEQSVNPIAEVTLAEGQCNASFTNLPYGTYELKEVAAGRGYALDTTPRTFTIPENNNDTITYTFENQPIRGDITFTKKDTNNNTPMANAVFEISSITANYTENHIVVADANGVVDTRDSVNPHTNNTNGYDELYYASETPIAYANYGTWFGKDMNGNPIPARNGVGALPYGTYLIQELKCDTNMFCTHLNNEKKTFTISENNQVVNLNDAGSDSWGNDCAEFSLSTTATDNADGDHYLEADSETVIKDVVAYCAKKNYTFTIKGILMDKATNQPLMVNGNTIEQSVEISPDAEDCGTVEMLFPVDSSELAGKSIVVFEKLYYKNEEKASHEDINDENQTVVVVSLGTVAVDNEDEDKIIIPGEETVIKDTVSYCAMAGKPFTITGVLMDKTTGQPILVDGQPVTQKVSFTSEQDCGTVEMIFPAIDTTVIAGHPIVVFETLNKVIPGEPEDTEEKITSHEDIDDEDQTVYPISISTTVQPNEDGTKIFPHDAEVTITDIVHYCLQPGLEYTVKGIVMDKSTGNGILVDSQTIEQSVTFTPTEVCGEFPMYYTFNTKDLSGAKLVIFESLYYDDELLIEHKDIENELESFEIDIETPDTGFVTKNEIIGSGSSHQEFLIIGVIAMIPVGIYAFSRYQARKRFYNR